ncbi:MAG: hypothetical protein EOO40_10230, partial [Deltaproteobacteria bacterium]
MRQIFVLLTCWLSLASACNKAKTLAASDKTYVALTGGCPTGGSMCSQSVLMVCVNDSWQVGVNCADSGQVCTPADSANQAVCASATTQSNGGAGSSCTPENATSCAGAALLTCTGGIWQSSACTEAKERCLQNVANPGTYACQASLTPSCAGGAPPTLPSNFISFSSPKGKLDWAQITVFGNPPISSVKASINGGDFNSVSLSSVVNTAGNMWKMSPNFAAATTLSFLATDTAGFSTQSADYSWTGGSGPAAPLVFEQPIAVRDATVVVSSKAGPLESGSTTPLPLDGDTFGVSLTHPNLDDVQKALLKGLKPAYLRFPSSTSPPLSTFVRSGGDANAMTPAMVDQFVALCRG